MRRTARSVTLVRWLRLAVFAVLAPAVAGAMSYNISTFADDAVVNGNCTLREAIRAANLNVAIDACPAGGVSDVITLPSGTYPFSGGESLLNGGNLTIQSATLDPLTVSIDLGAAGHFLALGGGGSYVLAGLGIVNGLSEGTASGGAISAVSVALQVYRFRFLSNHSAGSGGALHFSSSVPGANLSIHDGKFIDNQATGSSGFAQLGGGAFARASNGAAIDIRDVMFLNNTASDTTASAAGGALVLHSQDPGSSAACIRCTFSANSLSAPTSNPSFSALGGAVVAVAQNGSRTRLVDSRFVGNSTSAGGGRTNALHGVATSGGELLLDRLYFDANSGLNDALACDVELGVEGLSSRASFYDSQITYGTSAGLRVYTDAVVELGHLTIASYNGIGLDVTSDLSTGQVYLQNSILAFNSSNVVLQPGSAPIIQAANMTGVDPLFVNEPGGNYHLTAVSPAVDVGANAAATVRLADLDHHGRLVGGTTDLGCYEYDGLFADDFEVGDAGSWSPTP